MIESTALACKHCKVRMAVSTDITKIHYGTFTNGLGVFQFMTWRGLDHAKRTFQISES